VIAVDPEGDPLGHYLRSLGALRRDVGQDVLVLPGHNLPFYGVHTRIDQLIAHHEARCDLILHACRTAPRSAAELVPFVFTRKLDPHQMGFAFSEVLAHVNYMLRLGMLTEVAGADGIRRVTAAAVQ
jgi:glyoxylase-like metal-dependent hydrolase (beta-lactamase superfamily II)